MSSKVAKVVTEGGDSCGSSDHNVDMYMNKHILFNLYFRNYHGINKEIMNKQTLL